MMTILSALLALPLTVQAVQIARPSAQALPREIFLIAGQSNSANHGSPRMTPTDRRVFNWKADRHAWRFAADPQAGATGDGGSPWPVFGSKLAHDLDTAIGLVTVGVGGTAVRQWLPDTGEHFWRLEAAVKAFPKGAIRAVLWHQGESDVLAETTADEYAAAIRSIMKRLDAEAGYTIPWLVAEVSYWNYKSVGDFERTRMSEIRRGQQLLWDSGAALRGPTTDDLTGPAWRWDGIHLNEKGLTVHGTRWAEAVEATFYKDRRPQRMGD